jgi:O-antigen ligase
VLILQEFKLNITHKLILLLVIPCYIIFFIGKEPLIQGLAFSCYPIALGVVVIHYRSFKLPRNFILFWIFFLLAWSIPSLINYSSGRLESDLVNLEVLSANVFFLSSILFAIIIWLIQGKDNNFIKLLNVLFTYLLPIVFLIILKTIYLKFLNDQERPSPFGIHPVVASEILFVSMIGLMTLKKHYLKLILSVPLFIGLFYLESRAYMIASFFIFFVGFIFPFFIKFTTNQKIAILLIISFCLFSGDDFILNDILKLNIRTRGFDSGFSGREFVWEYALQSIMNHPWLGVGYWVNIFGYSIPADFPAYASTDINHPALAIHNAFIRIAAENGLILACLSYFIIGFSILKAILKKLYFELAIVMMMIFVLFFSTRHLTNNLMNLIFYTSMISIYLQKTNNESLKK